MKMKHVTKHWSANLLGEIRVAAEEVVSQLYIWIDLVLIIIYSAISLVQTMFYATQEQFSYASTNQKGLTGHLKCESTPVQASVK